jgi:cytochrome bd-type quinol oxidase subunit 2
MSKPWFTILGILAVLLSLCLHRSLWVALKADGGRARSAASRFYWLLCCSVLAFAVSGLISGPIGAVDLNTLPPQSIGLMIAGAGLLGIRFCSAARMDLGAFVSSGVLIAGLLLSFASGFALWIVASLLTIVYSARIFSSLRNIAGGVAEHLDSNAKFAGSSSSLDEAYIHSR